MNVLHLTFVPIANLRLVHEVPERRRWEAGLGTSRPCDPMVSNRDVVARRDDGIRRASSESTTLRPLMVANGAQSRAHPGEVVVGVCESPGAVDPPVGSRYGLRPRPCASSPVFL